MSDPMIARGSPLGRIVSRAGWGIGDQALSSLSNFVLGIWVARNVSPQAFGGFTIAFASFVLALGTTRALASEPLVVRFSGTPAESWRPATAHATGTAVAVGAVLGVCAAVVGALVGGTMGAPLVSLGIVLPGLLLQDAWRYAFFADGKPRRAFYNDLIWLAGLIPALVLATRLAPGSAAWMVVAWGASSAVAAGAGIFQASVRPAPRGWRAWLAEHRDLAPRYLGDFAALSGASHLVLYGTGAIAGLAAAGALRAAQILVGPLHILLMGATMLAVPEGVRLARRSGTEVARLGFVLSVLLATGAVVWGWIAGMLLPDRIGVELLGASWESARPLIFPAALVVAALGASAGAEIGLRSLAAARRTLGSRLVAAPLTAIGGLSGAVVGDAAGAAWGLVVGTGLSAVVWWRQMLAAVAEHRPEARCSELERS